jgi:hypothetical protein
MVEDCEIVSEMNNFSIISDELNCIVKQNYLYLHLISPK